MKRLISLCLAAVMLLSACAGMQVTAFAETYGDFEYTAADGKATVTGYNGSSDTIYLPSMFTGDTVNEVVAVGNLAFYGESDIEEIHLPNTLVNIGASAFHECTSLNKIDLGTGVETIGPHAFRNCFALRNISFPASVTFIGVSALAGTASLATITVDAANTAYVSVDNVLFTKDMKTLLRAAAKTGVKEYAIPAGVETVQNFAFDTSDVEVLTVPASVKSFGNNVFDDAALKKVIYQGKKEAWDAITIGDNNAVLYDGKTEFVFEEEHVHSYTPSETKPATCKEEGVMTYTCSCGDFYTVPIEKKAHTPAEAVRENEVPATCMAEGSYDAVVYCSVCEEEISRETKTIDRTAHILAPAVRENETPATCAELGYYDSVIYCSVCGDEMSRARNIIPKVAHTPGAAVKENEVPATYKAEGSYDEVIRCSVCKEELSRRTVTVPKLDGKNGWYKVNGKWYLYKDNVMLKYWQKDNGKWYYMNSQGVMLTGWLQIKGVWYYLGVGGDMKTGWNYINKKWYYFASSGAMQTGWVKDGGKWYYLESSGAMLISTSKKIGSKTYKFDAHGVCLNP